MRTLTSTMLNNNYDYIAQYAEIIVIGWNPIISPKGYSFRLGGVGLGYNRTVLGGNGPETKLIFRDGAIKKNTDYYQIHYPIRDDNIYKNGWMLRIDYTGGYSIGIYSPSKYMLIYSIEEHHVNHWLSSTVCYDPRGIINKVNGGFYNHDDNMFNAYVGNGAWEGPGWDNNLNSNLYRNRYCYRSLNEKNPLIDIVLYFCSAYNIPDKFKWWPSWVRFKFPKIKSGVNYVDYWLNDYNHAKNRITHYGRTAGAFSICLNNWKYSLNDSRDLKTLGMPNIPYKDYTINDRFNGYGPKF